MRKSAWFGAGVIVIAALAATAVWLSSGFDDAQADSDRQTVECLGSSLSAQDRAQLAQFADRNDTDAIWRVYDRVFPDCAVRGDQRERKAEIEASAWRQLQSDRQFMHSREANAAVAAGSH